MAHQDLIRRAEAAGISASYLDWRKKRVQVPPETLTALIDAIGSPGGDPPQACEGTGMLPRLPRSRSFGLTVQLYSVRSRQSWGHGDLADLADLAAWSARELGAGFIVINPLHAGEPATPLSDSPYLPMTRRYVSPLYLRIEDIPEFARLDPESRRRIEQLAGPLRAASRTADLIDRDRVWAAKRQALELIHGVARTSERERTYRAYAEREGAELATWATWCALAEQHGADWRLWPAGLRDPGQAVPPGTSAGLTRRAEFHAWLQWLLDEQRASAQARALAAGMTFGVIGDLAVGAHPGGADAWAHQALIVPGVTVGAPPDGFNQRGQDWAQPPWHPHRLAEAGGRPLADLFAAALRHSGGLRVDHVMGLMRLWWIPAGMPPAAGAYVRYDHRMMVGAMTAEAARAGAVAIGEDLGTVDQWIRRYLASQHVLGTSMLWFARQRDGSPLPPEQWRRACMATVGTHDVPPVTGFVTGDQVAARARLGLLADPAAEGEAAKLALSRWTDMLVAQGLLATDREPSPDLYTVALYGFLARTRALLVGVSLADAVGDRRTQNVPGTATEYPNWRVPLCDAEGNAVLLDDLPSVGLLREVVRAVSAA